MLYLSNPELSILRLNLFFPVGTDRPEHSYCDGYREERQGDVEREVKAAMASGQGKGVGENYVMRGGGDGRI